MVAKERDPILNKLLMLLKRDDKIRLYIEIISDYNRMQSSFRFFIIFFYSKDHEYK